MRVESAREIKDEGWKRLAARLAILMSPSFEARETSGFDICPMAYHGCCLAREKATFDSICKGDYEFCGLREMIMLSYIIESGER